MSIYLNGLRLKNYRGIGSESQSVAPFKKCNFFIGTNNSGKSCILNFISSHLHSATKYGEANPPELELSQLEIHQGALINQVEIAIAQPLAIMMERGIKRLGERGQSGDSAVIAIWGELLKSISPEGFLWVGVNASNLRASNLSDFNATNIRNFLSDNDWERLWGGLTNSRRGDVINSWIPQVIENIISLHHMRFPPAKLIPAIRQIGNKGGKFNDFSGAGLIDRLAELQNPGPTERNLKKTFQKINKFLQEITGDNSVSIEIPHNREEVLVHKGTRELPLSSLGTGIHEVVMIAAFCTLTEDSIVCIEEPEIHLHPLLQKKLIKYISEKTSNQYFIATHSASIIDHADATVFHVTQHNESTKIELAAEPHQRFRVCHDLGYRASDMLQTNAIIWVEGPSDRIYINHWIRAIDVALEEGIHYSIMFYGGRLLSHLSADDLEVSDFISLRRLNRNFAVIIDSDKNNKFGKINNTKRRVVEELRAGGDIAWVTAGREIENYLSSSVLNNVFSDIYKNFDKVESDGRYSHRLSYFSSGKPAKLVTDVNKVKIARRVTDYPADLSVMDLSAQMNGLVNMIRNANI